MRNSSQLTDKTKTVQDKCLRLHDDIISEEIMNAFCHNLIKLHTYIHKITGLNFHKSHWYKGGGIHLNILDPITAFYKVLITA